MKSDEGVEEAAFLAALHDTPRSTRQREGVRSSRSDFHHGLPEQR